MANTRINFLSPRSDASLDPPRYLREINSRYNISLNFPGCNSQNTQRRRPIRERLKRRNRNWRLRPREKASNIPTAPSPSSSSSFPSSSSLLFLFLFSAKKIPTIVRSVPGNLFSAREKNAIFQRIFFSAHKRNVTHSRNAILQKWGTIATKERIVDRYPNDVML